MDNGTKERDTERSPEIRQRVGREKTGWKRSARQQRTETGRKDNVSARARACQTVTSAFNYVPARGMLRGLVDQHD